MTFLLVARPLHAGSVSRGLWRLVAGGAGSACSAEEANVPFARERIFALATTWSWRWGPARRARSPGAMHLLYRDLLPFQPLARTLHGRDSLPGDVAEGPSHLNP